jgi:hypothetical protein
MEAEKILLEYAFNIERRRKLFKKVADSEDFTIYKNIEIPELELAVMRGKSVPHYHTQKTFFCFLDDAIIALGGLNPQGIGVVSDYKAKAKQVYPVGAYVIHAAAPATGKDEVSLLIFTPSGERSRLSEYPDDTVKPEIKWV